MNHWWDGISLRTKITGITVLLVALGRTLVDESEAAASGVLSEMKFTSGGTKSSRTLGSMADGYGLDRVMSGPKFKPGSMHGQSQVLLPPAPSEELA